jgi:hypothetical protein
MAKMAVSFGWNFFAPWTRSSTNLVQEAKPFWVRGGFFSIVEHENILLRHPRTTALTVLKIFFASCHRFLQHHRDIKPDA